MRTTPVSVSSLSGVSELTAGSDFTCARLSDGTAKCWGLASNGRLGNNDTTNQLTPVSVSGLTGATQISSRSQSTCAVISGNAVKCWGRNDNGQLGSTDTYDRLTPIQAGE
jgi:alpha-tubulin suppressor-like RCC1 family protein